MAKTKISEFSATPGNNTDIDGINIAEGCAPSGINDAIRELMAQLKDWQAGTSNDPYVVGSSGSLTLSYGTANGVPYLNGSKVVTSGSALTFDGTNFATTGSVTSAGSSNSGNLTFTGTGNRITGDFSNATIANRVMFQTSTANSSSAVSVLPSGTSSTSAFQTYNNSDPTNASLGSLIVDSGSLSLQSTIRGTGTYLPMNFYTGGSERMRVDTSGNVGIGTSSPLTKFTVSGGYISQTDGTVRTYLGADGSGGALVGTTTNQYLRFITNDTERARIDSSGNLLVGTTSGAFSSTTSTGMQVGQSGQILCSTTGTSAIFRITSTGTLVQWRYQGTVTGDVTTNGTTTAYNTSSDYRLKENIAPMTGALAKVVALKPCTYTWKNTGEADEGFIAHELQEVCPSAVTGEKDAVDAEGNPQYQGIDTSFLVATLTAAIQELKAINDAQAETITALTSRVTALESN